MSKQSEARCSQGYVAKAIPKTCANCVHLTKEVVTMKGYFNDWEKDTNLRCLIGGFAVKKMGSCNLIYLVDIEVKS